MFAATRCLPTGTVLALPKYVHQNYANYTGNINSGFTFSPTTGASAGDKVILYVGLISNTGNSPTVSSVTDSNNNTWTVDVNGTDPNGYVCSAFCSSNLTTALTTSSTIAINLSSSLGGGGLYCCLDEWNFPTAAGVDKTASGASYYSTGCSAGFGSSTTNAADLIVTAVITQSSTGTSTSTPTNSGFVALNDAVYYFLPEGVGNYSAGYGWTNDSNGSQAMVAYLP